MNNERNVPVKIRRISIKNYKGIDHFEMDFPAPRMLDDPDIIVFGSRNGLGKTSIIECCALLLHTFNLSEKQFRLNDRYPTLDLPDFLIKAGEHQAEIVGNIVIGAESCEVTMRIDRRGVVKITRNEELSFFSDDSYTLAPDIDGSYYISTNNIKAICGFTSNPVLEDLFLLFHSYRKVQEGNPDLGMLVEGERSSTRPRPPGRPISQISHFKLRILSSLMSRANLFELTEDKDPDETIEKLNELVKYYAGGTITKLRPSADNTVDFRIEPTNGGETFTFDGLSSGQKEIISTLFLIWYHTQNKPSVVFIDEPELHLNAQWHRGFVKRLIHLAPQNQYIIATHSEDVMDSVEQDRRMLLIGNSENLQ